MPLSTYIHDWLIEGKTFPIFQTLFSLVQKWRKRLPFYCSCTNPSISQQGSNNGLVSQCPRNMSVFQTCLTFVWRLPSNFTMDYIASSDKCLTFHCHISRTLVSSSNHQNSPCNMPNTTPSLPQSLHIPMVDNVLYFFYIHPCSLYPLTLMR